MFKCSRVQLLRRLRGEVDVNKRYVFAEVPRTYIPGRPLSSSLLDTPTPPKSNIRTEVQECVSPTTLSTRILDSCAVTVGCFDSTFESALANNRCGRCSPIPERPVRHAQSGQKMQIFPHTFLVRVESAAT